MRGERRERERREERRREEEKREERRGERREKREVRRREKREEIQEKNYRSSQNRQKVSILIDPNLSPNRAQIDQKSLEILINHRIHELN